MEPRQLTRLLEETAADVGAPPLAEAAWTRARIRRRNRRLLTAAVAGLAVAAVAVGLVPMLRGADLPEPVPPAVTAPYGLPAFGAGFAPEDATPLSRRPIAQAVALSQRRAPDGATVPQPIHVLGTDGRWSWIDVVRLRFTRDEDGNQADPLRSTSLSPDRRKVAVAQPDALVVVDLTTAGTNSLELPGFNQHVLWQDDTTVLVGRAEGIVAVNLETARRTPIRTAVSPWDIAVRPGGDGGWLELPATGQYDPRVARPVLREWTPDLDRSLREVPLDGRAVEPMGMLDWYGPTLPNDIPGGGDVVVRSGWGYTDSHVGTEMVAAVDARSGRIDRVVALGPDRWKGCCPALGWADRSAVLLQTERDAVVAWDVGTGRLTTVSAGRFDGVLAVDVTG